MAPVKKSLQLRAARVSSPDPHLANLGATNQLGVPISDKAWG